MWGGCGSDWVHNRGHWYRNSSLWVQVPDSLEYEFQIFTNIISIFVGTGIPDFHKDIVTCTFSHFNTGLPISAFMHFLLSKNLELLFSSCGRGNTDLLNEILGEVSGDDSGEPWIYSVKIRSKGREQTGWDWPCPLVGRPSWRRLRTHWGTEPDLERLCPWQAG